MINDEGTAQEPRSLTGDISPTGAGQWLSYVEAARLWGIQRKAVYRRVRRGQGVGRTNPETGEPEVWVPAPSGTTPAPGAEAAEEPRSLAVPDAERVALAIEASIGRALSPLHETIERQQARIEELVRENERLRVAGERRSRWEELRSWWAEKFG